MCGMNESLIHYFSFTDTMVPHTPSPSSIIKRNKMNSDIILSVEEEQNNWSIKCPSACKKAEQ